MKEVNELSWWGATTNPVPLGIDQYSTQERFLVSLVEI